MIRNTTTDSLRLNCIVDGESAAFSVKIPPARTVDDLKNYIKDKKSNGFSYVDADNLTLWGVLLLDDDEDERTVKLSNLQDDEKKKLKSTRLLSEFFPAQPLAGAIHIIIQRPQGNAALLSLCCSYCGQHVTTSFLLNRHRR